MEDDIAYWMQLARPDLASAQKSFQGDSYLHCLFGCQQALEKLLKALVVNTRPTNFYGYLLEHGKRLR